MQLSPEVEVARKGKGRKAKRERCASYNDEDILGRGTGTDVEGASGSEGAGNEDVKAGECEFRKGRAVLAEIGKGSEPDTERALTKADGGLHGFMVGGMALRREHDTK